MDVTGIKQNDVSEIAILASGSVRENLMQVSI